MKEDCFSFKLVPEPDECQECGSPGNGIAISEVEELLKVLDHAVRLKRKLGLAGQNLATKMPQQRDILVLENIRKRTWSVLRVLWAQSDWDREDNLRSKP